MFVHHFVPTFNHFPSDFCTEWGKSGLHQQEEPMFPQENNLSETMPNAKAQGSQGEGVLHQLRFSNMQGGMQTYVALPFYVSILPNLFQELAFN